MKKITEVKSSSAEDTLKVLKSIMETKNEKGWSQYPDLTVTNIEWSKRFPILLALLENDLIINKEIDQYKLKNGLTEQIVNEMKMSKIN